LQNSLPRLQQSFLQWQVSMSEQGMKPLAKPSWYASPLEVDK
jgi:hypothetical protein